MVDYKKIFDNLNQKNIEILGVHYKDDKGFKGIVNAAIYHIGDNSSIITVATKDYGAHTGIGKILTFRIEDMQLEKALADFKVVD